MISVTLLAVLSLMFCVANNNNTTTRRRGEEILLCSSQHLTTHFCILLFLLISSRERGVVHLLACLITPVKMLQTIRRTTTTARKFGWTKTSVKMMSSSPTIEVDLGQSFVGHCKYNKGIF